jgi:hypothetical protein
VSLLRTTRFGAYRQHAADSTERFLVTLPLIGYGIGLITLKEWQIPQFVPLPLGCCQRRIAVIGGTLSACF